MSGAAPLALDFSFGTEQHWCAPTPRPRSTATATSRAILAQQAQSPQWRISLPEISGQAPPDHIQLQPKTILSKTLCSSLLSSPLLAPSGSWTNWHGCGSLAPRRPLSRLLRRPMRRNLAGYSLGLPKNALQDHLAQDIVADVHVTPSLSNTWGRVPGSRRLCAPAQHHDVNGDFGSLGTTCPFIGASGIAYSPFLCRKIIDIWAEASPRRPRPMVAASSPRPPSLLNAATQSGSLVC